MMKGSFLLAQKLLIGRLVLHCNTKLPTHGYPTNLKPPVKRSSEIIIEIVVLIIIFVIKKYLYNSVRNKLNPYL